MPLVTGSVSMKAMTRPDRDRIGLSQGVSGGPASCASAWTFACGRAPGPRLPIHFAAFCLDQGCAGSSGEPSGRQPLRGFVVFTAPASTPRAVLAE